jgi:glycosyltransferase involved in cell wall biosynthesis
LYNKAAYIERALQSVRAQTCPDFEIIVIDDGSTDAGGERAQRYLTPRDRLLRQENAGVSAARNRGVEAARADLVAFLDADDEWLPQFLATILELRAAWPEAAVYATACEIVYEDGGRAAPVLGARASPVQPYEAQALVEDWLQGVTRFWPSMTVVVKQALVEAGGFPVGVQLCEDADVWLRLALQHPIVWSPRVGALYHQPPNAGRLTKADLKGDHPWCARLEAYAQDDSLPPALRASLPELIARRRLIAVRNHLTYGRPREARKLLGQCRDQLGHTPEYRQLARLCALPAPGLWLLLRARRLVRRVVVGAARRPRRGR